VVVRRLSLKVRARSAIVSFVPHPDVVRRLFVVACRVVVVTGVGALGVGACGRSSSTTFPCPAVGDDCAAIAAAQADAEAAYERAAAAKDGAAMDESAQCVQLHVDAAIDAACVDHCDELCRLHPCDVLDKDGTGLAPSACPVRCAALLGDGAFDEDDLDVAVFKAAENPGFCTCRACTVFDDALCTRLFDCAILAQ
jgi:hypothetical protein